MNTNSIIMPPIGVPNAPNTTALTAPPEEKVDSGRQPSFADVFSKIFGDTVEMDKIMREDQIRLVLGEADDVEMIQTNKEKAAMAVELLVNIRNTVLDSYNEIIRMQI